MKRSYVDLHLCLDFENLDRVSSGARRALELGYSLVAVPVHRSIGEQIQRVKRAVEGAGVDFVSRIDLRPRTAEELVRDLRKLRRRFEVIAVMCESKNVARQAAKDRRVDLLNFPQLDFRRRFFDSAEAELASSCLASFEIEVKPLLTLEGPSRVRLLSTLRRETAIAREFRVPIVVSSGVSDGLLMRKPREMAALASLFDVGDACAVDAVSKNPCEIVKRNREKLDSRFVAPGIRVIRRGKDC